MTKAANLSLAACVLLAVLPSGCGSDDSSTHVPGVVGDAAVDATPDQATPDAALDAPVDSSPLETGTGDAQQDAAAEAAGDAGGPLCSVVGQDCPGADKCTMTEVQGARSNACVAPTGAGDKTLGQGCTRDPQGIGYDDCAAGLLCTFLPATNPSPFFCRQLCEKSGDCAGPERCHNLGTGPNVRAGVCLPTCTLWGTGCAANQECRIDEDPLATGTNAFCWDVTVAVAALGEACGAQHACVGPDVFCDGLPAPWETLEPSVYGTCRATCDDAHACADSSTTCKPIDAPALENAPPGFGVCK